MTVGWTDVEEAVKACKPKDASKFPDLLDMMQQHLALVNWFRSQDLDVARAGTSLSVFLGLMMGASAGTNILGFVNMLEHVLKAMETNALIEMQRRNHNEKRKNDGR